MKRRAVLGGLLSAPMVLRAQEGDGELIVDTATGQHLSVRDLIDRLVDTDVILIGERHGFAPHQNRTAFLLQALAERGRYPSLALEMLEPAQEPVIEQYRRDNPEYARGLGIALNWANTGWPEWSYYEPIFQAAFSARLPIIAADLPRAEQRAIERNGTPDRPEDPAILESWKASMMAAHCNVISEDRAFRLALKQWKRDVHMSGVITKGNCVLLAGRAHVHRISTGSAQSTVKLGFIKDGTETRAAQISWVVDESSRSVLDC